MTQLETDCFTTPRDGDLGLLRISNRRGLSASLLPNGAIFAIEHANAKGRIMVNQTLGCPMTGSIGRLYLRVGGSRGLVRQIIGSASGLLFGSEDDRFVWQGAIDGIHHQTTFWLHDTLNLWLWHVEVTNRRDSAIDCDTILIQDLGLARRSYLMTNEAFASHYLDHWIARHPGFGFVLMSRQNRAQNGVHPWVAHGCIEGGAAFATDLMQVFGPAHRGSPEISYPFGTSLPSRRLQHEAGCASLQTREAKLPLGASTSWTFFAFFEPDHPAASSDDDLAKIEEAVRNAADFTRRRVPCVAARRSLLQDAPPAAVEPLTQKSIDERYPERLHEEWGDGRLLSFFTRGRTYNRHVILREKELRMRRRHGALLRSGRSMLPDETILSTTCWMHGVFSAQLAIGNASNHKLFSVSRDPYNIIRGSGLRILMDGGDGWRALTVPSAFEIGLNDCRWIYSLPDRVISLDATVAGDEPAITWRVAVEGDPCRFIVSGKLVMGVREFEHAGHVTVDRQKNRLTFRLDPSHLWSQRYPEAVYHLVTGGSGTAVQIGGDEILDAEGKRRGSGFGVLQTEETNAFFFAVVGSLRSAEEADALAAKYSADIDTAAMLAPADEFWRHVTRGFRIEGAQAKTAALDTIFPWLAHDAMVHFTVLRGLEQYGGAAWGTRDICQGPVEFLLALEHDDAVKAILRILFAEQSEKKGDWPQWFMLEPYQDVRARDVAHGDVIVWPLKAVCDYIEATGDIGFLEEPVPWRREGILKRPGRTDPIAVHLDKLIATVCARFIPGTHLIRYGNGDWNDSLQPVDEAMRERMVSSWTVGLLYQQLGRFANILERAERPESAGKLRSLAGAVREDFCRYLMRDGTVAGYGVFDRKGTLKELLLHPSDSRTGLRYSLLAMTQAIIGGLFNLEQTQHHLALIRDHLCFPDGVRLMDRPVTYRGGPETLFRRAKSSAFFGREIGLMYVHSHLRYGEVMAALGDAEALWDALQIVNPIAVTDRLSNASLRQRNAYFTSSDAAFSDRYEASAEWARVKAGTVAVDGGWRIYSSGPGLYIKLLIRDVLGIRRQHGKRIVEPLLPEGIGEVTLNLAGQEIVIASA